MKLIMALIMELIMEFLKQSTSQVSFHSDNYTCLYELCGRKNT